MRSITILRSLKWHLATLHKKKKLLDIHKHILQLEIWTIFILDNVTQARYFFFLSLREFPFFSRRKVSAFELWHLPKIEYGNFEKYTFCVWLRDTACVDAISRSTVCHIGQGRKHGFERLWPEK